jgi:hypothetical protein
MTGCVSESLTGSGEIRAGYARSEYQERSPTSAFVPTIRFVKDDKVVAQTSSTKTRVDVGWFIGDAKEFTLRFRQNSRQTGCRGLRERAVGYFASMRRSNSRVFQA